MTISMYQASIPHFIYMLNNLRHILEKSENYAKEKNFSSEILVNARLFPDMYALNRQVQIACDMAKGCGARLSGVEAPKFEDNETSFADLIHRINSTINFLKTLSAAQIDGTEDKHISFRIKEYAFEFTGLDYVLHWAIPNVYFHITTTYNILRHNGVPLSKSDFLRAGNA